MRLESYEHIGMRGRSARRWSGGDEHHLRHREHVRRGQLDALVDRFVVVQVDVTKVILVYELSGVSRGLIWRQGPTCSHQRTRHRPRSRPLEFRTRPCRTAPSPTFPCHRWSKATALKTAAVVKRIELIAPSGKHALRRRTPAQRI